MPEEITTPSTEGAPENTPQTEAPTDYREYVKWRETGELPEKDEAQPAAAAEETPPAKTEPQSGADDSQQPEEDEEPETDKPGRGSSRVRKIDRLTRENEMLRAQLAAAAQPRSPAEPAKPPEAPGKPKLQDFETLEQYQEALTDWKLDQREAQKKAEAQQAEAKSAEEKLQAAWKSSEKTARAAHPDYDDVIDSVAQPDGPGVYAARQAMLEDEAGAEILYYLGTHRDELRRIAALPPVSAIREIGKLSAALTKPSEAGNGKPKVSNAPKPPPALTRPGKTTVQDINDEKFARTDYKGWLKLREAQLKGQ